MQGLARPLPSFPPVAEVVRPRREIVHHSRQGVVAMRRSFSLVLTLAALAAGSVHAQGTSGSINATASVVAGLA